MTGLRAALAWRAEARTAIVGLGQQWMAAPAWMAATDPVGNGSRVMSARSSSTPLRVAAHMVGVTRVALP